MYCKNLHPHCSAVTQWVSLFSSFTSSFSESLISFFPFFSSSILFFLPLQLCFFLPFLFFLCISVQFYLYPLFPLPPFFFLLNRSFDLLFFPSVFFLFVTFLYCLLKPGLLQLFSIRFLFIIPFLFSSPFFVYCSCPVYFLHPLQNLPPTFLLPSPKNISSM